MAQKARILHVGEASFLSSGYAVYAREIQRRLFDSGKYELAELACYGSPSDPRRHELPWAYFGNLPPAGDEAMAREYESRLAHQYGEWSFGDVVTRFRPDIVWDIRDHWMLEHEEMSPHRRHFHWAIMPTVDARPQCEQWLSTFINADAVLTYSDWGQQVLRREGGGLIRLRGTAPPAADLDTFVPMDKQALRRRFGFDDGVLVVGTVMRNQPRKLYPQLIRDFAAWLRQADPEISNKTYLYLHTSYPDQNSWDIPSLIKESGIAHKILVTYRCKACFNVFPSFFQDARGACIQCGGTSAVMPNVADAVDRSTLACIINLFDVYVQYASSEGFGIPLVEAAACGVTVMATDYSAMSDVVRKLKGYPIAVDGHDVEPLTGCLRARPDGDDFIGKLDRFLSMSPEGRRESSFRTRMAAEEHYNWERTADRWMNVFDSLPLRPADQTWLSPPRLHTPRALPPEFPSNEAFVAWAIANVLGRPEMVQSYMALRMIRDLNWGTTLQVRDSSYMNENSVSGDRRKSRPFGTGDVVGELTAMCNYFNQCEEKRWQARSLS